MTTYRDREVSGIMIPCDDSIEINPEPVRSSIAQWLEKANIQWMGTLNCPLGMIGIFDDDGHSRRLPWNARAQFIADYPIVGNIIIFSQAWVDDGIDIVDLKPEAVKYFNRPELPDEYSVWRDNPRHRHLFATHRFNFPH